MADFRAILYDGKYHDVDSSDMAFKIAGSLAFKEAMKQARPALLEPIMHVEVYAPDQYSGDLMGDLSSRRGRISGSEARGHNVVVKAQVPFAEMLSYANDLTSMTQGRAQLFDGIFALRLRAGRTGGKSDRRAQSRPRRTSRRRRSLGALDWSKKAAIHAKRGGRFNSTSERPLATASAARLALAFGCH